MDYLNKDLLGQLEVDYVKDIRSLRNEFYLGDFTNIIKQESKDGIKGVYDDYDFCLWELDIPLNFRELFFSELFKRRIRKKAYQFFISIKHNNNKIPYFTIKYKKESFIRTFNTFAIVLLIFSFFIAFFLLYSFYEIIYESGAPIANDPIKAKNAMAFITVLVFTVLFIIFKCFVDLTHEKSNNNNNIDNDKIPDYFRNNYLVNCSANNNDSFYKIINRELYNYLLDSEIFIIENNNNCFYFELVSKDIYLEDKIKKCVDLLRYFDKSKSNRI